MWDLVIFLLLFANVEQQLVADYSSKLSKEVWKLGFYDAKGPMI